MNMYNLAATYKVVIQFQKEEYPDIILSHFLPQTHWAQYFLVITAFFC